MIQCAYCGAANAQGNNFCITCHQNLQRPLASQQVPSSQPLKKCPYCGDAIRPQDNFCKNCGNLLTAQISDAITRTKKHAK
jgi:predicted nucleic acid-binding Zn ribbon protein